MKTQLPDAVPPSISEDDFEQCSPSLKKKGETPSVKAKALSLLTKREHSQKELFLKLKRKGFAEEEIQETLVWATEKQFLSDERFAQSLVRRRSANFGNRAIQAELGQHGLDGKAFVHSQPDSHEFEALSSELERAYDWLHRRYCASLSDLLSKSEPSGGGQFDQSAPAFLALRAKAFRALSARGFEFDHIHKAWKRLLFKFESDA